MGGRAIEAAQCSRAKEGEVLTGRLAGGCGCLDGRKAGCLVGPGMEG